MEYSDKNTRTLETSNSIPIQPGLFEYPPPEQCHPALLGSHCQSCGRKFFPKRTLCTYCFVDGRMEELKLDNRAVIYAVTVVHIPSPMGIQAPYAYGYVDILTDNIRIFALFTGDNPSSFHSGQEVELVIEPVRTDGQGHQIIGYKFRPVLLR